MSQKQAVKVVIRTRPTPNFCSKNLNIDQINSHVTVHIPKNEAGGFVNNVTENWKFKFDKIIHNASQEEVFDYCALETVQQVANGYNGTVMCYGQTGAGKTFTMNGSTPNYKYRGVIPRAINQIYQEVGRGMDHDFNIMISYLEIYNEQIYDLLSDAPRDAFGGSQISIQDDAKGEVHVRGLSLVHAKNEEEALNLLFEGETRKTLASTKMNEQSSRAHCIYTIHVERKSRGDATEKVVHSKLNLVDLAGSERTKKLEQAARMKEANYINKSLSFLEQVVVAAQDNKQDHVPYRQSKLTNFLKNSIGGNCRTVMIANIWPEETYLEETISTLKFATRMMKVQNEPIINELQDPILLLKKYQREVRELKQELIMHDSLTNRQIQYDPYTPEQQYDIQLIAESYLKGQRDEVDDINSMRQVKELLAQMKNCYHKLKQDGQSFLEAEMLGGDGGADSEQDALKRAATLKTDGVGKLQEQGEFGLGLAPKDSKPVNKIELSKAKEAEIRDANTFEDYPQSEASVPLDDEAAILEAARLKKKAKLRPAITKQEAFLEFKVDTYGKEIEETIRDNRSELNRLKKNVRSLTNQCNASKQDIDVLKVDLDRKQDERRQSMPNQMAGIDDDELIDNDEGAQEIIDEEELLLLQKMKELKKQYRAAYSELRSTKSQVNQLQGSIDQAKQNLVTQFEIWYDETFEPGPPADK